MTSMFSPPRREKARALTGSHLPKGDCRYIMLHPEASGLRCACMGFSLNDRVPGSSCDCGHLACYHSPDTEPSSAERHEIEALREKINMLEERLDQERISGRAEMVDRLGRLEETVDKAAAENETQIKGVFRGISGLWHNVGHLQKKSPYYDDLIEKLADEQERIQHQLEEVDDASMRLEDRVELLENVTTPDSSYQSRRRRASTPPSICPRRSEEPPIHLNARLPWPLITSEENVRSFRERVASVGSGSQAWTVHISLLPTLSQPFPFEKDTAAYKRCLSRGLHRVVAIPNTDSYSFHTAVNEAFSDVLRGRPWQPLVARICDAKHLRGLPMLRRLPDLLVRSDYDVEFLQKNCAVTDESGKIIDLYIAMTDDTISWRELKEVSRYMDGLEASWIYDPFLDGPEDCDELPLENIKHSAGDLLPTWSPTNPRQSMKRKECEITRTPSFGSTTEASRTKFRRQYTDVGVDVVRPQAEAV